MHPDEIFVLREFTSVTVYTGQPYYNATFGSIEADHVISETVLYEVTYYITDIKAKLSIYEP